MRTVIHQTVTLPAPPEKLFWMYLDPAQHAAFTGHAVTIGAEPGAPFEAFGGALSGAMLRVVAPRLIVQSWRSVNFPAAAPDSTLFLSFTPEGREGRIDLVHVDVPVEDFDGVTQGWEKFYWMPWREFLARG